MSQRSLRATVRALGAGFLGQSPIWYKLTILAFLLVNPLLFAVSPYIAGWALVLEFIFTLVMALRCYPLQPGGLLALEAVAIGMTTPTAVYEETVNGIQVVLLLVFMVAGIFFLKQLLLFVFTNALLGVRSKRVLSLLFCSLAAVLSAFLDALTVMAVVITSAAGFYGVYHKAASGKQYHHADHDPSNDDEVRELHREDLEQFRAFLRSLIMHAAVGTALGGVMTLVGEPQNLLIATVAGWEFGEFFMRMLPISAPVFGIGLVTCFIVERLRWFGYGAELPQPVRTVLEDFARAERDNRTPNDWATLIVQAAAALLLVAALAFHVAAVGLVGLALIVLATAFTGVTEEHRLGRAFHEALPFTALLAVFFAIVAVITSSTCSLPSSTGFSACRQRCSQARSTSRTERSPRSATTYLWRRYISARSKRRSTRAPLIVHSSTCLLSRSTRELIFRASQRPTVRQHSCSCSRRRSHP